MNRLAGVVVVLVLAVVGLGAYLYYNPQHMPRVFTSGGGGFQVPEPRSPMKNFRPPQF